MLDSWLYAFILTVDANFRLKLKDKRGNDDRSLGDGWAYWVCEDEYKDYLAKYGHQQEVRSQIAVTVEPDVDEHFS